MSDIAYLSATELIAAFRARALSPVEVLRAQIDRYEEVNDRINAITHTHFDQAMTAAQASENRYRRGDARPLEGITCALKDEDGLAGWIMTSGSALLAQNRLAKNTPVVDFLAAAGAVFHCQTTVPEFYFVAVTWSKLWGVTRNPWNLKFSVGGSSGGSGAALAAGLTTLATGSDMGGSIRIPASFNGLYGFKPPHGRVPLVPGGETMPQGTSGPLARTFADLALLQNVMTGPHPDQMTALRPALEYPTQYPGVEGLRIAYSPGQGYATIDPDVRANTEAALRILADQGADIEEVSIAFDEKGIEEATLKALLSSAMGSMLLEITKLDMPEALTGYANYFAEKAGSLGGPVQLTESQNYAAAMYAQYDQLFARGFDVFICPTTTTSKITADFDFLTDQLTVDGKAVDPLSGWILTPAFNLMYTVPVVNVPTGLDGNGVPTGMQIAARAFDDLTAFRVAAAYAQAAPPFFHHDLMPQFRDDR